RRDDAHHRALHGSLRGGRIGQLLADGDALALAYEPGEVAVHGVKRHAGHGDRLAGRLPARGEGDVEERRSAAGIVVEQLVEIAHAVEEQHVRVLTLDAQVLLHHRRMRRAGRVVHGARRLPQDGPTWWVWVGSGEGARAWPPLSWLT